jgi:hypothetical protein
MADKKLNATVGVNNITCVVNSNNITGKIIVTNLKCVVKQSK